MKTEIWNGHIIRFVDINDEWWAVAKDVAEALGLKQVTRAIHSLPKDGVTTSKVIDSLGRTQDVNIINEKIFTAWHSKAVKKKPRHFKTGFSTSSKNYASPQDLKAFKYSAC